MLPALVAQDYLEGFAVTVPLPGDGVSVKSRSVGEPPLERGSDLLVVVEMTRSPFGGQAEAVQLLQPHQGDRIVDGIGRVLDPLADAFERFLSAAPAVEQV